MKLTPEIGKLYKLDEMILKCVNISFAPVYTFQLCDEKGEEIIKTHPKMPGQVLDWGVRLVRNRINELIEVKS